MFQTINNIIKILLDCWYKKILNYIIKIREKDQLKVVSYQMIIHANLVIFQDNQKVNNRFIDHFYFILLNQLIYYFKYSITRNNWYKLYIVTYITYIIVDFFFYNIIFYY